VAYRYRDARSYGGFLSTLAVAGKPDHILERMTRLEFEGVGFWDGRFSKFLEMINSGKGSGHPI